MGSERNSNTADVLARPRPTAGQTEPAPALVAIPEPAPPPSQANEIGPPIVIPCRISDGQPVTETLAGRYVVLDFETTGLSPFNGARVIEVSAREVVDGQPGRELATFVDPGVDVPPEITAITGITTEMVRGAPRSPDVMGELVAFIGTSLVVGHNIGFDRRFLAWEAGPLLDRVDLRTLCTLLLSRRVFPGRRSYRLESVIQDIGITPPDRFHRASTDTLVTAQLFERICEHAQRRCGARAIDHELLDRLQRVKITTAHDWLSKQGTENGTACPAHSLPNIFQSAVLAS